MKKIASKRLGTKRKNPLGDTFVVTHANPRKLLGWNRTQGSVTRGYTMQDDGSKTDWYTITKERGSYGATWFTVERNGERIGQGGSMFFAKKLAEEDAEARAHASSFRDAPRPSEVSVGPRKGTRKNPHGFHSTKRGARSGSGQFLSYRTQSSGVADNSLMHPFHYSPSEGVSVWTGPSGARYRISGGGRGGTLLVQRPGDEDYHRLATDGWHAWKLTNLAQHREGLRAATTLFPDTIYPLPGEGGARKNPGAKRNPRKGKYPIGTVGIAYTPPAGPRYAGDTTYAHGTWSVVTPDGKNSYVVYDSPSGYPREGGSGKGAAINRAYVLMGYRKLSDRDMRNMLATAVPDFVPFEFKRTGKEASTDPRSKARKNPSSIDEVVRIAKAAGAKIRYSASGKDKRLTLALAPVTKTAPTPARLAAGEKVAAALRAAGYTAVVDVAHPSGGGQSVAIRVGATKNPRACKMNPAKRLTGRAAIAAAEAGRGTLYKYADPVDGARAVSIAEARQIVAEDPGLVYLVPRRSKR